MVSASRILTVSYGTFSCTLEGFDDPFSTMKSIAEYFRDLAADDRYFGAEPPTPDAEMLHRIAEREIHRRVEARVSDHGVVLRQMEGLVAPEAEDAAGPDETAPEAAPEIAPEAPAAAPERDEAPAAQPEPARSSDRGSIAAKLQRLRAVADTGPRAEFAEDQHAEEFFHDAPIEAAFADVLEESMDAPEDDNSESGTAAAPFADEAEDEDEAAYLAEEDDESIFAEDGAAGDELLDDEDETEDRLAIFGDDFEDFAEDEDFGVELEKDATDETGTDDAIANVMGTLDSPAENEDWDAGDEAEDDARLLAQLAGTFDDEDDEADGFDDEDESLAAIAADLAGPEPEPEAPHTGEAPAAEAAPDAPAPRRPMARVIKVRRPPTGEVQVESAPKDTAAEADLAEPEPEAEAAEPEAEAPEAEEAWDLDADFEVPGESTLSPEDEAALAAELAEVERDSLDDATGADDEAAGANIAAALADDAAAGTADEPAEATAVETADEPARQDAAEAQPEPAAETQEPLGVEPEEAPEDRIAARRGPQRTAFDDVDMSETDTSVDRILEKTNSALSSGEATRRRSAIQHLKAAVQATRADRDAARDNEGAQPAPDDPRDVYKRDLEHVVRPRRPLPAAEGTDGEGRPHRRLAPLVLVSEQRVDEAPDDTAPRAPVAPVRPRRVTKGNLALSSELRVVDERPAPLEPAEEIAEARPDIAEAPEAEAVPEPQADDAVEALTAETAETQAPLADDADEVDEDDDAGQADAARDASMVAGFRSYLSIEGVGGADDIVEAGVAYVTQEVGRPHVTRPQLMTLVISAAPEFSREEALRAFGKHLRAGRIEKLRRGVFVLSDKSRFFDSDA